MAPNNGILSKQSNHSVDETMANIQRALVAKGVTVFAIVDHSGEAEKVGLKMPPTKLVIFGSPKAGTPLMLAAPSIALDLPLKIIIWQDTQNQTQLSYNKSIYITTRYDLSPELANLIDLEPIITRSLQP